MFFTRDPARNDVTLEVQSADSPAGPWTTVEVRDTVDISPATTSRATCG